MSDWHNHLKHLEEKHWRLNKDIDLMERTGNFGDNNITEMKKERLHLKDEIAKLKSQHGISE